MNLNHMVSLNSRVIIRVLFILNNLTKFGVKISLKIVRHFNLTCLDSKSYTLDRNIDITYLRHYIHTGETLLTSYILRIGVEITKCFAKIEVKNLSPLFKIFRRFRYQIRILYHYDIINTLYPHL